MLLGRIDVGKGREGLYLNQLPELLSALADETRVESIRASTAIEGYEVGAERAGKLARQPGTRIRNRNEREFAGCRDAIDGLTRDLEPERISIPLILHLHRQLYAHTGGGGGRFKTDSNLITERDQQGRRKVVFPPPPPEDVEYLMIELVDRYNAASDERLAHPLVLLGALVLDFLAVHPVADGNGRLARLLTTHELLRTGYGVARYVSVEQRVYETRNSYYESLRQSQFGWHEAAHDVWPWIEYLAGVLAASYDAFEGRIASARSTTGMSKQQITRGHVLALPVGREFRLRDLRAALPGISDPTFRLVLRELKRSKDIRVDGTGPGAVWSRTPAP